MSRRDDKILTAIERARDRIDKYIQIMDSLYAVDVSNNADFQRRYNSLYRVRQKSPKWYQTYFMLMEEAKRTRVSFSWVLRELKTKLEKYEPSFSSKLVATIDPWKPVWDEFVLSNTGHTPPRYNSPTKCQEAVTCYASIQSWYERFLVTDEAKKWIGLFNANVPDYYKITDLKKIDFILWKTR